MLAVVFPGQGSQYVGMGKALYERYASVRELFGLAEEVCALPIKELCFEGPAGELTRTENLQPALTAVNLAVWRVFEEAGVKPAFLAGHSLGEYSALCAAGCLSVEDTFRLVKRRGEVMAQAAETAPGAMYAVIGLSRERLEEILSGISGQVFLANHNSPEQIVISGEQSATDEAAKKAKEVGAKVVKLKVSGAFHSPLMTRAAEEFRKALAEANFGLPRIPVVFNVSAKTEGDPELIRKLMAEQILSPVRWVESVEFMYNNGVRVFIEAGPKRVLSGLINKILSDPEVLVLQAEKPEEIEEVLSKVKEGG